MVTIINGTTNKSMASEQLRSYFQSHTYESGYYILAIQLSEQLTALIRLTLCGYLLRKG